VRAHQPSRTNHGEITHSGPSGRWAAMAMSPMVMGGVWWGGGDQSSPRAQHTHPSLICVDGMGWDVMGCHVMSCDGARLRQCATGARARARARASSWY